MHNIPYMYHIRILKLYVPFAVPKERYLEAASWEGDQLSTSEWEFPKIGGPDVEPNWWGSYYKDTQELDSQFMETAISRLALPMASRRVTSITMETVVLSMLPLKSASWFSENRDTAANCLRESLEGAEILDQEHIAGAQKAQ